MKNQSKFTKKDLDIANLHLSGMVESMDAFLESKGLRAEYDAFEQNEIITLQK